MRIAILELAPPGVRNITSDKNGLKKINASIVPKTLNITWIKAERFASALVPIAARTASMVEPMLLPNVIAAASSQEINPLYAIVITIAEKADEE